MTRILLDAGHGGGASSRRGFVNVQGYAYCNEGQNNFYFSKLLKQELEKKGFYVGLTRNNMNEDPSLPARGKMGSGYDLMISIHSNGGGGVGVEVWDSTNHKESDKVLGDLLCDTTSKALGVYNRGTKYKKNNSGSNFYGVLRNGLAKKNMILEMFFHDNYDDTVKFIDNHKQLAVNLATALAKYYKLEVTEEKPKEPQLTLEQSKFIGEVLSYILATKRRILPSVSLAQAIHESGWGKSELAVNGKNLFGIKAKEDWQGEVYNKSTKEQDKLGNESTIRADFRKYGSWKESVIDHDNFFVVPAWREDYYSKVLNATTWQEQCNALTGTYATDIQYAEKLKNIIRKYKLYKYDDEVEVVEDKNKPSDWAKEYWQEAIERGITKDGSRPKDNITREETVAMILRAIKE